MACSADSPDEASHSLSEWDASSVAERLARAVSPADRPAADRLRARWLRIAFDDRQDADRLLELRLAALDPRPAGQLLGHLAGRPDPTGEPDWWHYLRAGLTPDRRPSAADPAGTELAFQRDTGGLLRLAWQELTARCAGCRDWLDLRALKPALLSALSVSLTQKIDRTLVLELNIARLEGTLSGDTAEERYRDFSRRLDAGELEAILRRYPPLARLLATTVRHWVEATAELFCRLDSDLEAIAATLTGGVPLGTLTEVRTGLSDPHRGQRSVAALHFGSGAAVVYKPRSMRVDSAFCDLVRTLDEWGLEPRLPVRRQLVRDGYGWENLVRPLPCADEAEVARFYRQHGVYLMLMYLLGGTDFHRDNVIAHGEHPVFVDLEALFHQPGSHDGAAGAVLRAVDESVLGSYLLPLWVNGPQGAIELSGMGGAEGQPVPHQVPAWQSPATDEMREGHVSVTIGASANLPLLDGRPVGPEEHLAEIAEGFRSCYDLVRRHREELLDPSGPLHAFAGAETRHILRPTQIYYRLLRDSVHPDHLRDGLSRDLLLDRLWLTQATRPLDPRIVLAEADDLRRADIPVFLARPDSRSVWTSDGTEIAGYFRESGLSRALARLEALSDQDRNRQLAFIESSVATKTIGRRDVAEQPGQQPAELPEPLGGEELLDAARALGDRLAELACVEDDQAVWVGLTVTRDDRWTLAPVGRDLYGGTAGIALFLGYLGLATAEESYAALGRQALNFALADLAGYVAGAPVGGLSGSASVLHALAALADVYPELPLLELAVDQLDGLAAAVEADEAYDLLGGCAGAVPVLLELWRRTGAHACLDVARQCGERLLDAARPAGGGLGWPSEAARLPLAGFAHGAAGIAWALLELFGVTADERFRDAAHAALRYEATLFDPARGTWLDRRPEPDGPPGAPIAWCHGAPGVGLGRVLSLPHDDTPARRSELRIALASTVRLGRAPDHSLCHGDLGNADILLVADRAGIDPAHRTAAERLAAGVVRDWQAGGRWRSGVPGGVETPGLFLGLAGIGYGLLRVRDPDQVPSAVALGHPLSGKLSGTMSGTAEQRC